MKRTTISLIAGLILAVGVTVGVTSAPAEPARPAPEVSTYPPAPPPIDASFATGSWSWSTCRAGVAWLGVPGSGSYFFNQATPDFYYWLGGIWYQEFARTGYECGPHAGPRGGEVVYNLAVQPIGGPHVHAVAPRVVTARHIHFDAGCLVQLYNGSGATWAQSRIPCVNGAGDPIP